MRVETKTAEPIPQQPPDGFATADLAALDAELAGLTREEQERARNIDRARVLQQTLSAVRAAEGNVRDLYVELAKYDAALAAFKKVGKAVESIPAETIGGRPNVHSLALRPGIDLVNDIAEYFSECLVASVKMISQRRDRTFESIKASELRLAAAQEAARQLK
jgi:hypothetical protein